MLRDSFGRLHTYLRISVTDRCNLRCRYCMPPGGVELTDRRQILHHEEIRKLVQTFAGAGIRKIRITGGEPLIRRSLDEILKNISSVQPGLQLAITTNGLLLERKLDELVSAGITRINISLDTLNPKRFILITGNNGWQQVWNGIHAALAQPKIEKVKINVVLQRGVNDDEIVDFSGLTLQYPLDVRFIELMPVGLVPWSRHEWMAADEIRDQLPDLEEVAQTESSSSGPARMYRLPGAPGQIGLIAGMSCPACYTCNRLRLTAQGTLLRCLFDPTGLDLRHQLRSGCSEGDFLAMTEKFLAGKFERGLLRGHRIATNHRSPCLAAVGG